MLGILLVTNLLFRSGRKQRKAASSLVGSVDKDCLECLFFPIKGAKSLIREIKATRYAKSIGF